MEYKMSDKRNMYYIIYTKDENKYDYNKRCKTIKFDNDSKFVSFFDEKGNYVAIVPYSEIKLIEKRHM